LPKSNTKKVLPLNYHSMALLSNVTGGVNVPVLQHYVANCSLCKSVLYTNQET